MNEVTAGMVALTTGTFLSHFKKSHENYGIDSIENTP
jgi:hypothetical protein